MSTVDLSDEVVREFVAEFGELGGGYGGYNEDHEFFGYRQAI